jgi:hypothetical protein
MSELALLRSRVDDQSELIMLLKRRADETLCSAHVLEQDKEQLEQMVEQLRGELDMRVNKCSILERRFADLAANHEEIIKVSDQSQGTFMAGSQSQVTSMAIE